MSAKQKKRYCYTIRVNVLSFLTIKLEDRNQRFKRWNSAREYKRFLRRQDFREASDLLDLRHQLFNEVVQQVDLLEEELLKSDGVAASKSQEDLETKLAALLAKHDRWQKEVELAQKEVNRCRSYFC